MSVCAAHGSEGRLRVFFGLVWGYIGITVYVLPLI